MDSTLASRVRLNINVKHEALGCGLQAYSILIFNTNKTNTDFIFVLFILPMQFAFYSSKTKLETTAPLFK